LRCVDNTYFESITKWLPEALGLYRIILDVAYGSLILSLLLFTLVITNKCWGSAIMTVLYYTVVERSYNHEEICVLADAQP